MPGESDIATDIAKEIAKQISIKSMYDDAASPLAKQLGATLEDLSKTLRLVLAPLQVGAVLQDRFRRFIERSALKVPEEQRIIPAPQLLGPILEGIKYELHDSEISEMFSELLSRSMDTKHSGDAHPSFPAIIRQLSTDEAKILLALKKERIAAIFSYDVSGSVRSMEGLRVNHLGLRYPENSLLYASRFFTLGLIDWHNTPEKYEFLEDGDKIGIKHLKLSHVGEWFMRACSPRER